MVLGDKIMYMRLIILFIVTSVGYCCKAQKLVDGCWLPESYIDSLSVYSFKNVASMLKPIHSIQVSHDTIFMMSYQGEYLVAKIEVADNNGFEIMNFSRLINLSYSEASLYSEKRCFLYQDGGHLVMYLKNSDGKVFKSV